jgi:hypothetical protein
MELQGEFPPVFEGAQFAPKGDLSGGTIKFAPAIARLLRHNQQLLVQARRTLARRNPDSRIAVDIPHYRGDKLTRHVPTEIACWAIPGTDGMLYVDAETNVYCKRSLVQYSGIDLCQLYMLSTYRLTQLARGLEQLLNS